LLIKNKNKLFAIRIGIIISISFFYYISLLVMNYFSLTELEIYYLTQIEYFLSPLFKNIFVKDIHQKMSKKFLLYIFLDIKLIIFNLEDVYKKILNYIKTYGKDRGK